MRKLRKAAGLTGGQLAQRCHMSQSQISRFETGQLLPGADDVDRILHALDVDDLMHTELVALAKVANIEFQNVRADLRRGLHHTQRDLAGLEASATHMRHFLPSLVTGLLQVPEYIRAGLNTPVAGETSDTTRATAIKLDRQAVLHDTTKRFDFLLTEQALRWRFCEPSVMATQMDRLISVSRLPSVAIGALPLSIGCAEGPMSTFVLYDARLATVELHAGSVVLRDPKEIEYYRKLFDYFAERALWGADARGFIGEVGESFRRA
ncbi:helix-turn-helix protein [Herbihabitans rhizosphaerae]|uniref:Helix-turn-helix protein n=1 Tax=Herbihabitans rhizosphaerae TaxID=1872711 RepID=A0A4Q7KWW7_9PSEU|nr:helix-turn-helix transcriptional regulator [Herbihabitans rhizosphaerae]RZS41096.1 helix-turn-helix protein [Herbihabitans rhizosphaerae]